MINYLTDNFQVKCETPEQIELIFNYYSKLGYKITDCWGRANNQQLALDYFKNFPCIVVNNLEGGVSGNSTYYPDTEKFFPLIKFNDLLKSMNNNKQNNNKNTKESLKNQLPFQVNTFGLTEVKQMLNNLFAKIYPGYQFGCVGNSPEFQYLQFWFNRGEMGNDNCITHTQSKPYKNYEVVSIEEAVKRLTPAPFEPVKVKLNNEYTAEIQENGDVKVGCQTFEGNKIIELAEKIKNVKFNI